MTTKEAFTLLISKRAVHTKLGVTSENIRTYRNLIKNGEYPSEELMSALLTKAGYYIVQEKHWGHAGYAPSKTKPSHE